MKNLLRYAALGVELASAPVIAHHAAEGILDEEIYTMIDDMVTDTPHAAMDLEVDGGTTDITVSTRSVRDVENMIDDGLLEYAAMLDGEVSLVVEFDDRGGATVSITQVE